MAQPAIIAAELGMALASTAMAQRGPAGRGFRPLAEAVESVGAVLVWNGERDTEAGWVCGV